MLYRERLTVPLLWWLLAVGFAVSMLAAFGFYLGWHGASEPLWLRWPWRLPSSRALRC